MRVLILAYDFPPYVSVGGLRPYSWYRYLKQFGVEPVVVTRQWANEYGDERDYVAPSATDRVEVERTEFGTVLRAPHQPNLSQRLLMRHGPQRHRLIRKAVTAAYEVAQYYADVGPQAPLVHAARAHLREHRVDAIVATGNPFVLFRYASALSREFGIPWVADYRDPWSQDKRRTTHRALGRWLTRLERRIVGTGALITTPAESFRALLSSLHAGRRVEVVANGYDPEAMAHAHGVAQGRERLTIALTGTIYPWHPVESVFRELEAFAARQVDPPVGMHFVGVGGRVGFQKYVMERFPELGARSTFTPRLSNRDFLRELARANAFLLFNNYAAPGTRVYDYLALRRRILLCYSDDPDALLLKGASYFIEPPSGSDERLLEHILENANGGTVVRGPEHLRTVLTDLYREFQTTGEVSCGTTDAERYSRRAAAARMAELLRALPR